MFIKSFLSLIFAFTLLFANRGLIPLKPNTTIFAPIQRAMIAWNGEEEILLLTTDLRASDSTMVLEVLPLPSEPKVKKGDIKTFQKAVQLINNKIGYRMASRENRKVPTPVAEVTFRKKIGVHDISVVHLINPDGFVGWVKNYLSSLNYKGEFISEKMQRLIEEYIRDGFVWFVFDVINLGSEDVTNEPIQYQFKTDALFYPLKITSTASGNTKVELLVLTPKLLRSFLGLSIKGVELVHEPITITSDELKFINEDMYDLLKEYNQTKLRIWRIEGELSLFDVDLFAR